MMMIMICHIGVECDLIDPTWLHICAIAEHGFWVAVSSIQTFVFMTTGQYSLVVLTMDALSLIHFRKRVLHCLLKKLRVIVPISVSDSV